MAESRMLVLGMYARLHETLVLTILAPSTSVNSRFVIDPEKNGGLDYQYDEVVRGKENRKKMDAGTCECCKDVGGFHAS